MSNKTRRLEKRAIVSTIVVAVLGASQVATVQAQDPTMITGPDACLDCHEAAHGAWSAMKHQTSYRRFHTLDETKEVLSNLGLRSPRRAFCVDCHYTQQQAEGRSRARTIAGVSCESCHGAAREWLDVHNNFGTTAGGEKATETTESPEHKRMRLQQTAELGMIRPDRPYHLASNCLQCHTVPNEELVAKGGHTAGSEFELVAWLSGEVRHNFQRSADEDNRAVARDYNPQHRRRVLYVLGQVADLEHALRGLAAATTEGAYATAMKDRVTAAMGRLEEIRGRAPSIAAGIGEVLGAAGRVTLAPNNKAELAAAADAVKARGEGMAVGTDGSDLAGLDPLLPAVGQYKGTAYQGQ